MHHQFILTCKMNWFLLWPVDHCSYFCHSATDIGMCIDPLPAQKSMSTELQSELRLNCWKWFQAKCCSTILHQIWTVWVQCRICTAEVRHCWYIFVLFHPDSREFWHTSSQCWFKLIFITVSCKQGWCSTNLQYLYFIYWRNISFPREEQCF